VDSLAGFMEAPTHTNVWVEWHSYFIWGYENKSADELVNSSILTEFQTKVQTWTSRANANKLFLGEWTLANSGQFPQAESAEFATWAHAQLKVVSQATAGWAYWNWRMSSEDDWQGGVGVPCEDRVVYDCFDDGGICVDFYVSVDWVLRV
jgi:glucan 1,3-beta-glucosidase